MLRHRHDNVDHYTVTARHNGRTRRRMVIAGDRLDAEVTHTEHYPYETVLGVDPCACNDPDHRA